MEKSRANKELFDLKGKVAIITGGAGILGEQHAEALAEAGANIVLADVNKEKAEKLAQRVAKDYKVKAIGLKVDISSKKDVDYMVSETVKKFGKIDILVNNAQGLSENYFAPFEEYPLEDWNKVMAVNLTGYFLCSQAVGKQMLKQGSGVMVNISSIYGYMAPDQRIYKGLDWNTPAVYTASKAGVIGLTKHLATYWADKNIRVNCITPGGVFNNQDESFVKGYNALTPMGRMAKKDELKGALLYLASDASSYVTGQNIVVDGGRSVW